jgi:hypothetical protein
MTWEIFVILTALYSIGVIPIRIGINSDILGASYNYIDVFTYIVYVIDVLVSFRTTYVNTSGEEIRDLKVIAKTYMGSARFITDMLALLNFPFS